MGIIKTQTKMFTKLCCKECEDDVYDCARCGAVFESGDNIGCSELPDGKHYCEDCTLELSMETKDEWKWVKQADVKYVVSSTRLMQLYFVIIQCVLLIFLLMNKD